MPSARIEIATVLTLILKIGIFYYGIVVYLFRFFYILFHFYSHFHLFCSFYFYRFLLYFQLKFAKDQAESAAAEINEKTLIFNGKIDRETAKYQVCKIQM